MSKLKIVIPIVLVVLGGAYKFVLAKPTASAKPKVAGQVYVLGKEFLVNLSGGRYAKLTVGLVLAEGDTSATASSAEATPPDGFGPMPQEAVVRSDVTDVLTDAQDRDLINAKGRHKLQKRILKLIRSNTDVKADEVLFTDVTVQ